MALRDRVLNLHGAFRTKKSQSTLLAEFDTGTVHRDKI